MNLYPMQKIDATTLHLTTGTHVPSGALLCFPTDFTITSRTFHSDISP